MITLTNYASGELSLSDDSGKSLRLTQDQANRLVMTARMHTVAEFVEKLPTLIADTALLAAVLGVFQRAPVSSDKWNLKEKFARLQTLVKGYVPKDPDAVVESVRIE